MPTVRNTLEQGRANHAYIKAKGARAKDKFASYAKKLPMMIKSNGLGAAMAFAKSKVDWKEVYQAVDDWIREDPKSIVSLDENESISDKLVQIDSSVYRALTIEVLSYLSWLRRFAEGFNK